MMDIFPKNYQTLSLETFEENNLTYTRIYAEYSVLLANQLIILFSQLQDKVGTVFYLKVTEIGIFTFFVREYMVMWSQIMQSPQDPKSINFFKILKVLSSGSFSTTSALGEISTAPPNCNSNPYEKGEGYNEITIY